MKRNEVILVANGDLRLSANQQCQQIQEEMEKKLVSAVEREGFKIRRGHSYDVKKKHGFIDSQKYGIEVFRSIPKESPLIVAEAVWQYSQQVLPGLIAHHGPILTVANWSGTWPGLVGLLNLNASLTKAGVKYSSLWSEDFADEFFLKNLRQWLTKGSVKHDLSHVRPFSKVKSPAAMRQIGERFAESFRVNQAIMGVFDEGCMGMYNAIIPDELLNPTGLFKERLSQSALYAKMLTVSDEEARSVYQWCLDRGLKFKVGRDEKLDLTENQILLQCKMYIASIRIAYEFGCSTIGIQYQLGLKDLTPASDLVEGLLNNVERPPVYDEVTGKELFAGDALPHFNEVDECAGLDGLITYQLWKLLGYSPENTLHDLRWSRHFKGDGIDDEVWVFLISGAAPAAHFIDGYRGATSERQPSVYFQRGGGTLKGVSKPGWIVWSRVFIEKNKLKCDLGLAEVVKLPDSETNERWRLTTPQWPIMHVVFEGISRNQMMARHKSNHIQVVYAPTKESARRGLFAKAVAMNALGLEVFYCGKI
jgi:hypothetical protein